jgi:hypothetical protein
MQALAVVMVLALAPPTTEVTPVRHDTIRVDVVDVGQERNVVRRRGGPRPVAPPMILDPRVVYDPATGDPCLRVNRTPGDPGSLVGQLAPILATQLALTNPDCQRPANNQPQLTPEQAALQVWQQLVVLPRPQPRIRPGKAHTGREAFLEIGGQQTGSWFFQAFGFPITINATSTYDVDWGEGTIDRGVTSQGGPWPDGDIRHVYTIANTYTVTINQHWTARWSIGGAGGTIANVLRTIGTIDPFPVHQVQAVRDR